MRKQKQIVISLLLLGLLGCTNPFSTRNPEEPDLTPGNGVSGRSLQTVPDSILSKIKKAFRFRDPQSYKECLVDPLEVGTPFTFTPEKDEISRFVNWSRDDEILYFTNFVNNEELTLVNLTFSEVDAWTTISASTQDTLQTSLNYTIDVEFRTKTEHYQGRSILRILKSTSELWYIYQWEDFKLRSSLVDSTWSTLKANYRY